MIVFSDIERPVVKPRTRGLMAALVQTAQTGRALQISAPIHGEYNRHLRTKYGLQLRQRRVNGHVVAWCEPYVERTT